MAPTGQEDKIRSGFSESPQRIPWLRGMSIILLSIFILLGFMTILGNQKFLLKKPLKNSIISILLSKEFLRSLDSNIKNHFKETTGLTAPRLAFPQISSSTSRIRPPQKRLDGNQLIYLETPLVYYPHSRFPKLTTPMWIGEPGVETAIILSFDDIRDVKTQDQFLRPIITRLKQIEKGESPLSIMASQMPARHPILQKWINNGITIEAHTTTHLCPLLQKYDFKGALKDFHSCIDHLYNIRRNTPLAFRMPCSDSRNSVSPRFYSEIFSRPTPKGHTLRIDSSVYILLTPHDPEIPRSLLADQNGKRLLKNYIPPKFVNYIEDYPFPYLIHNSIWEFPCIIPTDWQAAQLFGRDFSQALADWKRALDAVVIKQGIFVLTIHPKNGIEADQVIELIDYSVKHYREKVKFLNFKEAYRRLIDNLLGGTEIDPSSKGHNGVRLLDLNNDGYLDVIIARPEKKETRIWNPDSETWRMTSFPYPMIDSSGRPTGIKFVRVRENGFISMLLRNDNIFAFHDFEGNSWGPAIPFESIFPKEATQVFSSQGGGDRGLRVVDVNKDGFTDLVYNNESDNLVLLWQPDQQQWIFSSAKLPRLSLITDETGLDRGHRFVDLNQDGFLDSVCSNEKEYIVALYTGVPMGWGKTIISGRRDSKSLEALPSITERGRLMGAWFRGRILYIQNERVGRRSAPALRYSFHPFGKPRAIGLWNFEKRQAGSPGVIKEKISIGKGEKNDPQYTEKIPCHHIYDPLTDKLRQNSFAIYFDGVDDYIRLMCVKDKGFFEDELRLAQTLETFVRLESPPPKKDYAGLLLGRWTQDTSGGDQLAIFLHGDSSIEAHAQSEVGPYNRFHSSGRGGRLDTGKWHHIAAVYWFDEESLTAHVRLYQDYNLVSGKDFEAEGPLAITQLPYQLGGEGDAITRPFRFIHAIFDEVRISRGVLSPDQFLRCGR